MNIKSNKIKFNFSEMPKIELEITRKMCSHTEMHVYTRLLPVQTLTSLCTFHLRVSACLALYYRLQCW